MKVSAFIEWLKTQDSVEVVEFTPDFSEYVDLRGNPFVKDDSPIKDSRTLLLGES